MVFTKEQLHILKRLTMIENMRFSNDELIHLVRAFSDKVISDNDMFQQFLNDFKGGN